MSGHQHQHQLSMDREFRYILQWFGEWSEIQREDFVPVLLECLACETDAAADGALPINGNVLTAGLAAASLADKPMSLFQCRVSSDPAETHGADEEQNINGCHMRR